ncbi:Molybdopterin synthase catalytic subunit [Venturia effusa]|uniref:Molybdopterin synthase catalytic subunit n=1 Tax=Venturia effusa TaxID=50376 RepID=A0A517KXK9_9PEZI|nr:Molybdopterin synthase catalytic subunit [Venturia effusa]
MADSKAPPTKIEEENIHVEITHDHLDVNSIISRVKSPKAGAIVLFAGTTRDNFDSKTVTHLEYQSYIPLALQTLLKIARAMKEKHNLNAISMIHRLGIVPIGEESILIAVSSAHRKAAWEAGEEALEKCKEKAEIWKLEKFEGEDGVWRANRDGAVGEKVES